MEQFLGETDSIYTYNMERAAIRYLDMKLSDVSRHDIAYLFRGVEFDNMFPRENLIPTLDSTLEGMGLGRENYPNIHIDIEPRDVRLLEFLTRLCWC